MRLAAGWMEEAGLEVEVDPAREPRRAAARAAAGAAGGLDRLAPRLGPAGRPLRRRARRRRRAGGGRAARAAGADARRRRLPRRGARVPRAAARSRAGPRRGCRARTSSCTSSRARGSRDAGAPLGVVTVDRRPTCGASSRFEGRAGHAGTTPMEGRADALVDAAEVVLRARDAARAIEGAVATVGRIAVEPGGANVIPGAATLSLDAARAGPERLDAAARRARPRPDAHYVDAAHMSERVAGGAAGGGRARAGCRCVELRVGRGPRRGRARGGRSRGGDALRPQPQRRRQPLARRAELERRGRRARARRARRGRSGGSAASLKRSAARPPRASAAELAQVLLALDDRREVVRPRAARPCSRSCSSRTGRAARSRSGRPGRARARPGAGSSSRSRGRCRARGRPTGSSSTRRSSGSG